NFAVDVIKIAHHGSKTSTSDAFISSLQPKYAIIQSGRVESFGFPDQEVIDILEKNNVVIYRTDQHYSIKIKYFAKKSIFATLR
ncbi:MAG TPA: DNA internalization-related competence protein ComEC/Rec2, partial [Bacilli bacterium]